MRKDIIDELSETLNEDLHYEFKYSIEQLRLTVIKELIKQQIQKVELQIEQINQRIKVLENSIENRDNSKSRFRKTLDSLFPTKRIFGIKKHTKIN